MGIAITHCIKRASAFNPFKMAVNPARGNKEPVGILAVDETATVDS
jgi:hypothetical protein